MYKINCKCPKQEYQEDYIQDDLLDTACQDVSSDYNENNNEYVCGFYEQEQVFPRDTMLGHAYVPRQKMDGVFTPCVGLEMGTIFPELVSPYAPLQSLEQNEFLRIREMGGCNCGGC